MHVSSCAMSQYGKLKLFIDKQVISAQEKGFKII